MRSKITIAAMLAALLAAGGASAQSLTGSVSGTVQDEQGGALPGATITLLGKAGASPTTTDARGFYRFPSVQPGTYELQAALQGFQPRRETALAVSVSRQLTLDLTLKVATVSESVDVSDVGPVVDVTSSASNNSISQDLLFNLPLSRFSFNLLNYAPGVNNDSGYGGGNNSGNSLLLDGVDTRSPSGGGSYIYLNYNIVQEVQIQGLGAPAEYGNFTGAVINTVTKSGGNSFEGLFDAQYTRGSFSSDNLPAEATAANPSLDVPQRTNKQLDFTAQVSGPIVKDKLFFFASVQRFELDYEPPGPRTNANEVTPRLNLKLTWQPSPSDFLSGSFQAEDYNRTNRPNSRFAGSFATTDETARDEDSQDRLWNVQWRHLFGSNTFSEVKYLGWTAYDYLDPKINEPIHCDGGTGECFGGGGYSTYFDRKRHQVNASLSHYAEAFGHHDLKFGLEIERSRVRDRLSYTGGLYFYDYYGAPYTAYSYSYDQTGDNHRESGFVQDSWRLNDRLTVNVGARFDWNRGLSPDLGTKVFDTKSWTPRLGVAWDVSGNRETVLRASYSRYSEGLFETYYYRVLPGLADTVVFDTTVDPFVEIDRTPNTSSYRMDPNLKHPRVDEITAAVERAFGSDVRLAVTGIYRDNKNFISSVNPSARWEETTVTSGLTNQPLTVYNWVNRDESELDFLITNPDGFQYKRPDGSVIGTANAKARYKALMFVLNKRLTHGWQAQVSYVLSKNTGALDPNTVENIGYGGQFETPTRALVNAVGEFQTSRRHEIKVLASVQVPVIDATLSTYFRAISGTRYTPYERFSSSEIDYPSSAGREPWLEPLGSRSLPMEKLVDLRLEKLFKIGGDRVAVYADIFNLFNSSLTNDVVTRVPDQSINGFVVPFEAAASIVEPRQIILGARWSF